MKPVLQLIFPNSGGSRHTNITYLIVAQYFLVKETRSVKRIFFLPLLVYFRNNNTIAPNLRATNQRVPLLFLKPFNIYSLLLSDHCGSRRGTNTYCFRKPCSLCLRTVRQCSIFKKKFLNDGCLWRNLALHIGRQLGDNRIDGVISFPFLA